MVEHSAVNRSVVSSSLSGAANGKRGFYLSFFVGCPWRLGRNDVRWGARWRKPRAPNFAAQPPAVLYYDEPFSSLKRNIKTFLPAAYEWTKSQGWRDKAKFYAENQARNIMSKRDSSGLNKKGVKYLYQTLKIIDSNRFLCYHIFAECNLTCRCKYLTACAIVQVIAIRTGGSAAGRVKSRAWYLPHYWLS